MNEYNERTFNVRFETIREWARTNFDIGNVLKGYWTECFALRADFEISKEIQFVYIEFAIENPGFLLKLNYREKHFYDYLLMFCTEICRLNSKLEIINVYNTFTNFYRTFLGDNDIEPFFSAELKALPRGGALYVTTDVEIIKSVDKVMFYRRALGDFNYVNFKEDTEYVYIMMNKDDMTFKIGQSKKPSYREKTLQSQEPQIVLLKVWECDKKIEKELHSIYKQKRQRGEWFKLDFGELCEFDEVVIKLIKQNANG